MDFFDPFNPPRERKQPKPVKTPEFKQHEEQRENLYRATGVEFDKDADGRVFPKATETNLSLGIRPPKLTEDGRVDLDSRREADDYVQNIPRTAEQIAAAKEKRSRLSEVLRGQRAALDNFDMEHGAKRYKRKVRNPDFGTVEGAPFEIEEEGFDFDGVEDDDTRAALLESRSYIADEYSRYEKSLNDIDIEIGKLHTAREQWLKTQRESIGAKPGDVPQMDSSPAPTHPEIGSNEWYQAIEAHGGVVGGGRGKLPSPFEPQDGTIVGPDDPIPQGDPGFHREVVGQGDGVTAKVTDELQLSQRNFDEAEAESLGYTVNPDGTMTRSTRIEPAKAEQQTGLSEVSNAYKRFSKKTDERGNLPGEFDKALWMTDRLNKIDDLYEGAGEKGQPAFDKERSAIQESLPELLEQLTPYQLARLQDKTRDATTGEIISNFSYGVAKGMATGLVDTIDYTNRQYLRMHPLGILSLKLRNAVTGNDDTASDNTASRFMDAMRETAEEWGPDVPDEVREQLVGGVSDTLGQATGSALLFMAPGAAVGSIGRAANLSDKAIRAAGTLATGYTGGAMQGNSMRREVVQGNAQALSILEDALASGQMTREQFDKQVQEMKNQALYAETLGTAIGWTEVFPMSRFVNRLNKVGGDSFMKQVLDKGFNGRLTSVNAALKDKAMGRALQRLGSGIAAMPEEAAQELFQTVSENAVASGWGPFSDEYAWDKDRHLGEGAAMGAGAGGFVGFTMGLLFAGLPGRQRVQLGEQLRQDFVDKLAREMAAEKNGPADWPQMTPEQQQAEIDEARSKMDKGELAALDEAIKGLVNTPPAQGSGIIPFQVSYEATDSETGEVMTREMPVFAESMEDAIDQLSEQGIDAATINSPPEAGNELEIIPTTVFADKDGNEVTIEGGPTEAVKKLPKDFKSVSMKSGEPVERPKQPQSEETTDETELDTNDSDNPPASDTPATDGEANQPDDAGAEPEVELTPRTKAVDTIKSNLNLSEKGVAAVDEIADVIERVVGPDAFSRITVESVTADQMPEGFKDRAGAWSRKKFKLFINKDVAAKKGDKAIEPIFHESGHVIAEAMDDFILKEYQSLKPEQREAAKLEYEPTDTRTDEQLLGSKNARQEWFNFQLFRVAKEGPKNYREDSSLSDSFKERVIKAWEEISQMIRQWVGDASLSTEAMDARIREILFGETPMVSNDTTKTSQRDASDGTGDGVTPGAGQPAVPTSLEPTGKPFTSKTPETQSEPDEWFRGDPIKLLGKNAEDPKLVDFLYLDGPRKGEVGQKLSDAESKKIRDANKASEKKLAKGADEISREQNKPRPAPKTDLSKKYSKEANEGLDDFADALDDLDEMAFAPREKGTPETELNSGFYSQLERVIEKKMPKLAPPSQVRGIIDPTKGSGVKAEEIKWSGIDQKLTEMAREKSHYGKVDKADLLDYLRNAGRVRFEEVTLGDVDGIAMRDYGHPFGYLPTSDQQDILRNNEPRFNRPDLILPGGENYREVVLTMPQDAEMQQKYERGQISKGELESSRYTSSHFPDTPNYVAHMRINERTDAEGDDGLFIEEIQSDRHQAGRENGYQGELDVTGFTAKTDGQAKKWIIEKDGKYYTDFPVNMADDTQEAINVALKGDATPGIPDAPFRKEWPLAMFKRALRDAVADGKDWIGWTVGETQADRYDLSKQVDSVTWYENDDRTFNIGMRKDGTAHNAKNNVRVSELPDIVGKEVAQKIVDAAAGDGVSGELSGLDLKVGGKGMEGFYDKMLPSMVKKYVNKWGGKVEDGALPALEKSMSQTMTRDDFARANGFDIYRNDDAHQAEIQRAYMQHRKEVRDKTTPIHKVTITPAMRESISDEGQMAFSPRETESFNRPLPAAKLPAFISAAQKMASGGLNTPAKLAEALEDKFGGKVRPYTQSLWGFIAGVDATAAQTPMPDWGAVYSNLQTEAEPETPQNAPESPQADEGDQDTEATENATPDADEAQQEAEIDPNRLTKADVTKSVTLPDGTQGFVTSVKGSQVKLLIDGEQRTVDQAETPLERVTPRGRSNVAGGSALASGGNTSIDDFVPDESVHSGEEMKLFEASKALIKKHGGGKRIMEGRNPKGTLGVSYGNTGNIAIASLNNIGVAAHEVAHNVDRDIGLTLKTMIKVGTTSNGNPKYDPATAKERRQLTDVYVEYYPGGKRTHPLHTRMVEGFATFIQKSIENPKAMRARFPELTAMFLSRDGKYYSEKTMALFRDAREIVNAYSKLSNNLKIEARKTNSVNKKQRRWLSIKDMVETTMADEIWPMEKLATITGEQMTDADPSIFARQYKRVSSMVNHNLQKNFVGGRSYLAWRNGTIETLYDFNWSTLLSDLQKTKMESFFDNYLIARRTVADFKKLDELKAEIERVNSEMEAFESDKDIPKELVEEMKGIVDSHNRLESILDKNKISRAVAEGQIKEAQETIPDIARLEKMFDALVRADLDTLLDAGIISKKDHARYAAEEGYATFKRDVYDDLVDPETGNVNPNNITGKSISSLKARTGSDKAIISPLYSSIANHNEIAHKAMRQIVWNKMADLADSHSEIMGEVMQKEPLQVSYDPKTGKAFYPQDQDENVMMARRDGKRIPYAMNSDLKIVLDGVMTPEAFGWVERFLVFRNRIFTKGTTGLYMGFAFMNLIVDQISAVAQSRTLYLPVFSQVKQIWKMTRDSDSKEYSYLREYLQNAGASQTRTGWNELPPDKAKQIIAGESRGLAAIKKTIQAGEKILGAPAQATEIFTRATEYISARSSGDSIPVALEKAGRIAGPFHHIGRLAPLKRNVSHSGKVVVRSISYMNSAIQVNKEYSKAMVDPKRRNRAIAVTGLLMGAKLAELIPMMLMATDDQKEKYKDMEGEYFSRYLFLPSRNGVDLNRYRIPEQMTFLAAPMNMFLQNYLMGNNYDGGDMMGAGTAFIPENLDPTVFIPNNVIDDNFSPETFFWGWMPQAITPELEVFFNRRTWPKVRDLEPQWMISGKNSLLPQDRTFSTTSDPAKWIGSQLGLSPIKVDHYLQGVFGRTVKMATKPKSEFEKQMQPYLQRYYFTAGRNVQDFYEQAEKTEQLLGSIKSLKSKVDDKHLDQLVRDKQIVDETESLLRSYRAISDEEIESSPAALQLRKDILDSMHRLSVNPLTSPTGEGPKRVKRPKETESKPKPKPTASKAPTRAPESRSLAASLPQPEIAEPELPTLRRRRSLLPSPFTAA